MVRYDSFVLKIKNNQQHGAILLLCQKSTTQIFSWDDDCCICKSCTNPRTQYIYKYLIISK